MNLLISTNLPTINSYENYKTYVNRIPNLNDDEELKLFYKFKFENSVESAQKLILSQLKNVIKIAKQFKGYGLPEEDLVQEGNIGLMKAVKNFNTEYKVRLYTYSLIWIKSEIQSYIIKNWKIVKIATTNNLKKLFFSFKSIQKELISFGVPKEQLIKEISKKLQVEENEVLEIKNYFKSDDIQILPYQDKDENSQDSSEFLDISDSEEKNPAFIYEVKSDNNKFKYYIKEALKDLKETQRKIIELRYFNEEKKTHKEIAKDLNLTTQRVQQIEKEILNKLKNSLKEKNFKYF